MRKLVILIGLFCGGGSYGQTDLEIFNEMAVLCTSHLGIAAVLTDVELSKMVFTRDAKWFRSTLLQFYDAAETDSKIEAAMQDVKAKWNDKEITWDHLLDICQQCSEMKLAVEQ